VKRTTSVNKRSIIIAGRKTSVSLEDEFWAGLKEIAVARNIRLKTLVSEIDKREHANLSLAIRLFGAPEEAMAKTAKKAKKKAQTFTATGKTLDEAVEKAQPRFHQTQESRMK
jgi:predicted DNA-binding ribbon-helix-helix protein